MYYAGNGKRWIQCMYGYSAAVSRAWFVYLTQRRNYSETTHKDQMLCYRREYDVNIESSPLSPVVAVMSGRPHIKFPVILPF
jgi:hypothetical protein